MCYHLEAVDCDDSKSTTSLAKLKTELWDGHSCTCQRSTVFVDYYYYDTILVVLVGVHLKATYTLSKIHVQHAIGKDLA